MSDSSPEPQRDLHLAYRVSGIARPVDPAYPTNKAVLVLAPAALVLGFAYVHFDGGSFGEAALAGLNAGLLVFFCWALTRELSPDDNPAAFVAVGLALAVWPRVGEQSILIPAATLSAVRFVNRSTGMAAKISDAVLVTAGLGALAWFVSWTCGVVGALALSLDALLPRPEGQASRRWHLGFAAVLGGVVAGRMIVGVEPLSWPAHLPVFASIAGLATLAVLLYPRPRSRGDVDEQPLSHARVRCGLAVGVLAAVLASVDSGLRLQELAGQWACVLAVPLGLPFMALRRRRS